MCILFLQIDADGSCDIDFAEYLAWVCSNAKEEILRHKANWKNLKVCVPACLRVYVYTYIIKCHKMSFYDIYVKIVTILVSRSCYALVNTSCTLPKVTEFGVSLLFCGING